MPTHSDTYAREQLAKAIEIELQSTTSRVGRENYAQLSKAYRTHEPTRISGSENANLFRSYLAGRMLATFGVAQSILRELIELDVAPLKSLVDLGAGPATVAFAAAELFELESVSLFEKEKTFRDLALKLADSADVDLIKNANWIVENLKTQAQFPKADLVTASYTLGEMSTKEALRIAEAAFCAASSAFVVIEPGTPKGFELVRSIREHLLSHGAFVAAPCAHQKACPMQGEDFCHFSHRLVREQFHRNIKGASLPYEDEKYAYMIFTKTPVTPYAGRIVKKPIFGSGHVTLDICTDGRINRTVVSRSQKMFYKQARDTTWGDRVTSLPTRDR